MLPINDKKRAALYIRVSTADQAERHGADAQEAALRDYCIRNDFEVLEEHIYKDDYSGNSSSEEREAMSRLMNEIRERKFDVVITWKVDRFFRNLGHLLATIDEFKKYGVDFIASSQAVFNTSGPTGKLLLVVLGIIAEIERDTILERTIAGKKQAALKGLWVGGKHPPFGYDVNKETQKIQINEFEAQVVRDIFHWYVEDKMSMYAIQQRLLPLKIPTKADKKDNQLIAEGRLKTASRTTNEEGFWSMCAISRVLSNFAYTGTYYYNRNTKKRDAETGKISVILRPKEEWVSLPCPPIISQELFDEAQIQCEKNKKVVTMKYQYLLSTKVWCGCCGSSYTPYMKGKFKKHLGKRTMLAEYPQYRCRKNAKELTSHTCNNRQISGTELERMVWEEVLKMFQDPASYLRFSDKELEKEHNIEEDRRQKTILEKEVEQLRFERQRAIEVFEKGLKYSENGEIEKKVKEIDRVLEKRLVSISTIEKKFLSFEDKRRRLTSIKKMQEQYRDQLATLDLDFDTKKEIMQELVHKVTINSEGLNIELGIINHASKSVSGSGAGQVFVRGGGGGS